MAQQKILLMSGNGETARCLSAMLGVTGDEIVVCADGASAFQKIWDDDYNVIVTELGGPGVDGRDLYMAFQNTCPELVHRMVFVCARPTEPLMDFAARTGVPFLQLPASVDEMREAMHAIPRTHSLA